MIRRAFTLIELLVAILVLLAVLLASGSIFSATSKVAGLGEANSDVNADLQAFEKSIRDDLHSISRDGFLMIRCVAVRNDIRRPTADSTRPLLDPTLDPTTSSGPINCCFSEKVFQGQKLWPVGWSEQPRPIHSRSVSITATHFNWPTPHSPRKGRNTLG